MTDMMYEYVVIRLTPDMMRGESINVGLAVFPNIGSPMLRIIASIAKVRALDANWNTDKHSKLKMQLQEIVGGDTDRHGYRPAPRRKGG